MAKKKSGYVPQYYTAGPFSGMRDSLEIPASDPSKALLIQNCYPVPGGGGLTGRPGFAAVGGVSGSTAQGIHLFSKFDGSYVTVYISSGEIYTVDWTSGASGTGSKVVTTANLTTNSVTLSSTARVAMVTYTNKVLISDGTNTPFLWDGTTGSGGITKLTNAPVFYGPPTVYYGKIFGIKNSDRSTFVWSEENDATTGYEAGGFNNAWDYTQNDTEPLTALLGTNDGLYVFRPDSVSVVTGAVDTDFVTTGTRAGVSESQGTTAPWSICYSRRNIFFLNQQGKPHMVRPGGEAEPIWDDFRETIKSTVLPSNLINAITVDYAPAHLILFGYTVSGDTYPSQYLVYDFSRDEPVAAAIWKGYTFGYAAMVYHSQLSVSRLAHMNPSTGALYYHGHTNTATWDDNLVAITHIVKAMPLGGDISGELFFDRVDWALRSDATAMTNSYDYVTNRGTSVAQAPGIASTAHQALGINAHARWICPRVTHATAGEQFGLERVRVRGIVTTDAPQNI